MDDVTENRKLLAILIRSKLNCNVILAKGGKDAVSVFEQENVVLPSLILLDIMMPGMDGYETARQIKHHPLGKDIPIIFITGMGSEEDKARSFKSGGVDFITKPFHQPELLARIRVHLEINDLTRKLKAQNILLENRKAHLQVLVDEQTEKIKQMTVSMVSALESANFYNDTDTGLHIKRVGEYSQFLARELGLSPGMVDKIHIYAPLHDVGKVGISDHILKKPGQYTVDEFEEMKQHVVIGGKILQNEGFDVVARNIALYHHEKWDGNGYIHGLKGEQIPIEARIVAVADVYDALTSQRSYKKCFSNDKSDGILKAEAGHHFDPEIIALFFKHKEKILDIQKKIQ